MKKFNFAKFFYAFFSLTTFVLALVGLIASMTCWNFVPWLLFIPGILFISVWDGLGIEQ